jgi:methanogenic corrinoid protein MtbC1
MSIVRGLLFLLMAASVDSRASTIDHDPPHHLRRDGEKVSAVLPSHLLREVGRLWQSNRIGIAQEHYCTACTQSIMSQLYPRIFSAEKNGRRLVATCVGGDLHEIGPRMVADFFEMEGWDTFFLGGNTPTSGVLQQVAERAPQVLAISATMSFHAQAVADLIAATRAAGTSTRILVGGTPFNSEPGLWKDAGADGCAGDAAEAIAVAWNWNA